MVTENREILMGDNNKFQKKASTEPLVDNLTRKMAAAWHQRGAHGTPRWRLVCSCGASGGSMVYLVGKDKDRLGRGFTVNSLCVHRLAFHRDDIPQEELDKVCALDCGEEEPTEKELAFPKR